jgi:hypothetical protein
MPASTCGPPPAATEQTLSLPAHERRAGRDRTQRGDVRATTSRLTGPYTNSRVAPGESGEPDRVNFPDVALPR